MSAEHSEEESSMPTVLPDRIDFTILASGAISILKMRRDTSNPSRPRDIPLSNGVSINPHGFDLEAALNWCRGHGYTVRVLPGRSARAWLGGIWVIRTRHQIKKMRERAERNKEGYTIDFAYDG